MDEKYYKQAEELADQNYLVQIEKEYLSTGELVFVATNPDLPNCIGNGETEKEAIFDLRNARIDYIAYMLQNKLPIPKPSQANLTSCTISYFIYPTFKIVGSEFNEKITAYKVKEQKDQNANNIGRFVEMNIETGC